MLKDATKQKLVQALEPLESLSLADRKDVWQFADDLEARGGPQESAVAQSLHNVLDIIGKE